MCEADLAKRIWESGMRNSAVHPFSSMRVATSHTPSHESSSLPSPDIEKSRFTPAGFTANS